MISDGILRKRRIPICAGYFDGDMLFDVGGLGAELSPVPSFVASTFALLTRGAPTRPSPQLQTILGFEWATTPKDVLCLVGETRPSWAETIRGGEAGYKPALDFLEMMDEARLDDWAFIPKLMIPEYPIFRLLGAPDTLTDGSNDEQVDFYLPQADLVVEIDGGQHRERSQANKDRARDRYLERFGILTLRLSTEALRAEGDEFLAFIEKVRKRCEESTRLQPYRAFASDRAALTPNIRYDLTAAIRLQIAMMLAIAHQQLDVAEPYWKIRVSSDFQASAGRNWINAAIAELFDWFALFSRLQRTEFIAPEILLLDEDGVHFDMRLFSRADDETGHHDGITICTSAVQDLPYRIEAGSASRTIRLRNYGLSALSTGDTVGMAEKLPSIEDLAELTRRVFGHDNFRPGQETLILNALSGHKSLGLMPTGGGKSLCFQVPALLGSGTTIVVVPIKALGRDHCAELESAGFTGRVVNIDSDMPASLRDQVFARRIARGEMRFVFVSPERFQTERFRSVVQRLYDRKRLRMFVVDEVHCMSEWGHDFRPSYLTLPGTLRELADDVPVLGLTATASVNVLRDIQNEFEIPDELVAYEMHRSRTELNFLIHKGFSGPKDVVQEMRKIISESDGDTIAPVHIFTRYANGSSGVESLATSLANANPLMRIGVFSGSAPKEFDLQNAIKRLNEQDIPAIKTYEAYKQTVQRLWKEGRLDVMVTTKAFGMGVNKPDVRHTVHAGMPGSMEAFYQEAGRAGRDRKPAFCHMLFQREEEDVSPLFAKLREQLTPDAIEEQINARGRARRGDFRAQLWFLRQGLISIEEEEALVGRLHSIIRESSDEPIEIVARQLSDIPHGGVRFQLTLFRLYQMGLIAPWVITDWGRGNGDEPSVQAVEVCKRDTTFQGACAAVAERVKAVDGLGAEAPAALKLQALMEGPENWPELYRILLTWVRRTQIGSRLQSTWNLYVECLNYTPEGASDFREKLEAFFKVDNNAFQLAALRDMALDDVIPSLEALLTDPGKKLKERNVLRTLSAQLSRLLEGTQESPGLNLAAACFHLLAEKNPGTEARMRFAAAIPVGALAFWRNQGKPLLATVASSSPDACDAIGEWLMEDQPTREDLLQIHESIPARAVKEALFRELATEIAEVM